MLEGILEIIYFNFLLSAWIQVKQAWPPSFYLNELIKEVAPPLKVFCWTTQHQRQ